MEKLIELLNEHRAELLNGNIQNKPMRYSYGGYVFGLSDLTEQNCILLIISKSYGFIKWLVDNDKINLYKARGNSDRIYYKEYGSGGFTCSDEEFVLMLLAISDTPIQDLCVWLK